jgi:hypothetical protein
MNPSSVISLRIRMFAGVRNNRIPPPPAHVTDRLKPSGSALRAALEAEPHDQVRRDGDDFFSCRINGRRIAWANCKAAGERD